MRVGDEHKMPGSVGEAIHHAKAEVIAVEYAVLCIRIWRGADSTKHTRALL